MFYYVIDNMTNIVVAPYTVLAVTCYIFLLIVLLIAIKFLLIKNEINDKGVQKIIGGLSVFLVAIISNNAWVFTISLFIGGLIIASEEFMHKLAIIFRSRSEDIKQNLNYTPATKKELNKNREEESTIELIKKETIEIDNKLKKQIEELNKELSKAQSKQITYARESEVRVIEHLRGVYGDSLRVGLKINSNVSNSSFIFDAYLLKNANALEAIIEIKVAKSIESAERLIVREYEKSGAHFPDVPFLLCIVFDSDIMIDDLNRLINNVLKYSNFKVSFYTYKNGKFFVLGETRI